jgi:hypothetical protein
MLLPVAQLRLALAPLVFLVETDFLLEGQNIFRALPVEALAVKMLDVVPERHLPRFLIVVIQLAELGRIHPQLPRHLHLSMRETVPVARVDPDPHLLVRFFLRH